MLLLLGVVTFVAGAVLWRVSRRERALAPPWLARLGAGVAILGFGTLAMTKSGVAWHLVSIVASLVAIVIIFSVHAQIRRR